MRVAGLVVDERRLASCVLDVPLGDDRPFRPRSLGGELEDVECRARVAAGTARHERDELVTQLDVELRCTAPDDLGERLLVERLELVHLGAGDECGVDLVVRVLSRRADERHEPGLHARQQGVLLRLVEAVDLVEEEDRPPARGAESLPRPREHLAHVLQGRRHRGQLLERRPGQGGDDARERRLAAARRAVEDRGVDTVILDRASQRGTLAEDVRLTDEFCEARRPQPLRERRDLAGARVGRIGEEVTHDPSMLGSVPRLDGARPGAKGPAWPAP